VSNFFKQISKLFFELKIAKTKLNFVKNNP